MHRTVLIPSGPLRFSGTVPARRALVFDAREGRWMLRREAAPAPARPRGARRGAIRSRAKALALGALGVVVGLAAGALVDRFGPEMGAVGSGSLPVGAVPVRVPGVDLAGVPAARAAPPPVVPEHEVAHPARGAMDEAAVAALPVPPFVLARANRDATLPAAPPVNRAALAARRRTPARRAHEHEPPASDEPILDVPVPADPVAGRARTDHGVLDPR